MHKFNNFIDNPKKGAYGKSVRAKSLTGIGTPKLKRRTSRHSKRLFLCKISSRYGGGFEQLHGWPSYLLNGSSNSNPPPPYDWNHEAVVKKPLNQKVPVMFNTTNPSSNPLTVISNTDNAIDPLAIIHKPSEYCVSFSDFVNQDVLSRHDPLLLAAVYETYLQIEPGQSIFIYFLNDIRVSFDVLTSYDAASVSEYFELAEGVAA